MKKILIVIIILLIPNFLISKDKILKIYYYERPPFYYTDKDGIAKGIIIDKVKRILKKANIKYSFQSFPVKRIFLLLEENYYACSPGWFKTEERLKKFKYTLPFYQSEKMKGVFNKNINVEEEVSLKKLFTNNYKLGLISGFNYGPIIEKYLKIFKPKVIRITTEPNNLIKMVALRRLDYTFFSYEHIKEFIKLYPDFAKNLKIVSIKEIKHGIKRYIICSKKVDNKLIEKMNIAIKELNLLNED